jgi:hypothetical protein
MWAGVAVMAGLFLYILARGPKNTTPTPNHDAGAPEAVSAR